MKTPKYQVKVESVANEDFGPENWEHMNVVPAVWVPVNSFAEAVSVCSFFITNNEMGGGNWAGGQVVRYGTKEEVARISYNGKVWKPGKYPTDQIETEEDGTPIVYLQMIEVPYGCVFAYFLSELNKDSDGGYIPCIAKDDERGYWKTNWNWGADRKAAQALCDEMNSAMGIDRIKAAKIQAQSMRKG